MNMDTALKKLIRTMKALSDPNRVRILKYLQHRSGMCVCELTALLHISQPTVSKHLKVLEKSGFVESSKEGLWMNYALARHPENPFAAAMLRELSGWLEEEPAIQEEIVRAHRVRREVITGRQSIPVAGVLAKRTRAAPAGPEVQGKVLIMSFDRSGGSEP